MTYFWAIFPYPQKSTFELLLVYLIVLGIGVCGWAGGSQSQLGRIPFLPRGPIEVIHNREVKIAARQF